MELQSIPEPDQPLARAALRIISDGPIMGPTFTTSRNESMVNEWLEWLEHTANRAPSTVLNYAGVALSFLRDCVGDRLLDSVTEADVEAWLLRPRRQRALGKVAAPATRARNVAILKSMFRWLHARGYVERDLGALLIAPKVANRQPKAIPDGLWLQALTDVDDQMLLTLGLGFWLGLRRAEIVAVTADHIDPAAAQIVGLVRKGGGDDLVPYGELLGIWQDHAPTIAPEGPTRRFLGLLDCARTRTPLGAVTGWTGPDSVNKALKVHLDERGMRDAFTPHALRHSFCTNLLRIGMPLEMVSELANHSDISVTMRYVKGGGGRLREWRAQHRG